MTQLEKNVGAYVNKMDHGGILKLPKKSLIWLILGYGLEWRTFAEKRCIFVRFKVETCATNVLYCATSA